MPQNFDRQDDLHTTYEPLRAQRDAQVPDDADITRMMQPDAAAPQAAQPTEKVGAHATGSPSGELPAWNAATAVMDRGASPAQEQPAGAAAAATAAPAAQPATDSPQRPPRTQPASGPQAPQGVPAYAQPGAYQNAAQVVYQQPVQKKSYGWIIALVIIVCLFAFTAFCVKTCSDTLTATTSSYGAPSGAPSPNSIAVINIDGTIQYDGSACSPEGFKELLDEAKDDSNVKAVVLRVNSGGGTATAGEEMAEYLREFEKPVVVSSASINASAAYEISSQANYIYVAKSTEIGAIGTAMEISDMSGLMDMLGIDMEVITSADSKDSSYGYRPLTQEERDYYQHMVDQINETFLENVAAGRTMTMDEVRALATGLPFTGIDAVQNGLADEVGTLEDAIDKAASLAGVTDYEKYDLGFSSYGLSELYDLFGSSSTDDQRLVLPRIK